MNDTTSTARIAQLNDRCRKALGQLPNCRLLQTAGVTALHLEQQRLIHQRIAAFETFPEGDDPYGEHDFGAFDIEGTGKVFWKIDYYAPDMEHGSEDPSDPARTVRVLTIMLASEY